MDVIEHLDDDLGSLQTAVTHLRPGGVVAINVPAHTALYSKYDEMAGHKRRYNSGRIVSLFEKSNLTLMSITNWGFSLIPILAVRKLALKFVPEQRAITIGFQPSGRVMNAGLNFLKRIEMSIPIGMPAGSSIMALGRLKQSALRP
jgi:hypothetical protein